MPTFNNKVSITFSDTDSFLLLARSPSTTSMVQKLRPIFDTSNYSKSHLMYNPDRKSVTGFLKNETPEMSVKAFVGLRSKCYCIKLVKEIDELIMLLSEFRGIGYEEKEEREARAEEIISRAKGVKKHARQQMKFDTFLQSLFDLQEVAVKQKSLISKSHLNKLVEQSKVAFSPFDAKRALTCLIHSVPYGSSLLAYRQLTGKCYSCEHPEDLF